MTPLTWKFPNLIHLSEKIKWQLVRHFLFWLAQTRISVFGHWSRYIMSKLLYIPCYATGWKKPILSDAARDQGELVVGLNWCGGSEQIKFVYPRMGRLPLSPSYTSVIVHVLAMKSLFWCTCTFSSNYYFLCYEDKKLKYLTRNIVSTVWQGEHNFYLKVLYVHPLSVQSGGCRLKSLSCFEVNCVCAWLKNLLVIRGRLLFSWSLHFAIIFIYFKPEF